MHLRSDDEEWILQTGPLKLREARYCGQTAGLERGRAGCQKLPESTASLEVWSLFLSWVASFSLPACSQEPVSKPSVLENRPSPISSQTANRTKTTAFLRLLPLVRAPNDRDCAFCCGCIIFGGGRVGGGGVGVGEFGDGCATFPFSRSSCFPTSCPKAAEGGPQCLQVSE